MEATQVSVSNGFEDGTVFDGIGGQLIEASAGVGPIAASSSEFCTDMLVASFENKRQSTLRDLYLKDSSAHPSTTCDPTVQVPASTPGVSNCYVFKSRLQEYAQKVGLPTPVYETIKEGPSHEPSFRSTVIVGGARYESLPGFFNRKAAEQSAAEVSLMELSKSGEKKDSITMPVHETGLCKNLLQEYAQKMNYAIPTYICRKDDTPGRTPLFSCTVEIGAIQYIGAAARTKKEAEIRAARTALLAIRSSGNVGDQEHDGKPQYTVVPCKRKMPETAPAQVKTAKAKKPKKPRFKKKPPFNRIQPGDPGHQTPIATQVSNGQASSDLENAPLKSNLHYGDMSLESYCGPQVGVVDSGQTLVAASSCQPDHKSASVEPAMSLADASKNHKENSNNGIGKVIPVKAPLFPSELDASPTDFKINQEALATIAADKNPMGDANNVSKNIPSA